MRSKGHVSYLLKRATETAKPSEFFARTPVFRLEEFRRAYLAGGRRQAATSKAVLKQHVAAGNLINVRRGLYAVVPPTAGAATFRVDPFLIASRLTEDAVVAYHAALQLHGLAHSISTRITYLTALRVKPFRFQDIDFVPVQVPISLRATGDLGGDIVELRRHGLSVRVTSPERTLVDVLDAPEHGGGWEEIWRSLQAIEVLDVDAVVAYALRLGSALTIARVGYFLEQHRELLLVEEHQLAKLQQAAPRQPTYFERRHRSGGTLVRRWNLIVPDTIRHATWAEVT